MSEFKPFKSEKVITSIRIEVEKLELIDRLSVKSDISRNEFIMQCIDFALASMSEDSRDSEESE